MPARGLNVNPLHVGSLSVESNFKKTYFSTIYSGTVPLGSNALLLSGSANTIGDFATEVRLQLPWCTKAATGTSFIFGKASVELWQKTLDNYEFNLGYSHKLQASHDVNFELSFSYNFNHDGYVTETNTYLGEHIAFSEYAMNWVFARPLWSVGASSTVWSEKMTLSPKFAFMLGDKNWDLSFGLQFTNTISLTYGRLPIDLGLKVMYYMEALYCKPGYPPLGYWRGSKQPRFFYTLKKSSVSRTFGGVAESSNQLQVAFILHKFIGGVEDEERVVVCSCGANHIGNDLGSSCRGLVVSFCREKPHYAGDDRLSLYSQNGNRSQD